TCVAFTPGTKHNDLKKGCAGKIYTSGAANESGTKRHVCLRTTPSGRRGFPVGVAPIMCLNDP
ncbi:unnamed protein product, partial [Ectocarpus fasciculatus]